MKTNATAHNPELSSSDEPRSRPTYSKVMRLMCYPGRWHRWYWAVVPLLAVAAYITVLWIGFLADDFFQLHQGLEKGVNPIQALVDYDGGFLRPVGVLLTFQVGWALFGYNPLPYHIVSLLAHAATSLILGLWLATLTRKPALGWLAGSLFAVFPLHVEAVGWVGAQFDAFATLFGIAALWAFTLWWLRRATREGRAWLLYLTGLFLFSLAAWTKESVFTFVPVLTISAWVARPPDGWRERRSLLVASAFFLIPIALSILFRLIKIGSIGGYGALSDYTLVVWDALLTYLGLLLAPINEAILGKGWVQIVGVIMTLALLVGLAWFGRMQSKLLILAGVWIALTLLPILNLAWASDELQQRIAPITLLNVPEGADNLQQNRYLYLVSAGYLVGVAVLLYSAIRASRKLRPIWIGLVAVMLLLSTSLCWVQLKPWHTATVQANEVVSGLLRAIPPQERPNGMAWHVERLPFKYQGVPLLLSGLGISRVFEGGDYPNISRVADATQAHLAEDPGDSFALRFRYDEATNRFPLDYLVGITQDSDPPTSTGTLNVWDFRECDRDSLKGWRVVEATSLCEAGKGLTLTGESADPQLVGENIDLGAEYHNFQFVRLRVSAKYPQVVGDAQPVSEWFWRWPGVEFSGERLYTIRVERDGLTHVYWTFIPTQQIMQPQIGLRFDPVNLATTTEIKWIALDLVK